MIQVSVKDNLDKVSRQLDDLARRQLPFATARALTRTALEVRDAEKREMGRVFDRPTRWTMNSLYVKPATKQSLSARVWLKDSAHKGTPADKYLAPEITGGSRAVKRFERAFQAAGIMPKGTVAVPGPGARLDASGNVARGQIVQLLAYFKAFSEQGYKANMDDAGRAKLAKRSGAGSRSGYATIGGVEYFVSRGRGHWQGRGSWRHGRSQHLPAGIWARRGIHGSDIVPVMLFVRSATYRKRFPFFEVAHQTINRRFNALFGQSIAQAIAQARRG